MSSRLPSSTSALSVAQEQNSFASTSVISGDRHRSVDQGPVDVPFILQAWATLLRCYVSEDLVTFGLLEPTNDPENEDAAKNAVVADWQQTLTDPKMSISPWTDSIQSVSNTAVTFTKPPCLSELPFDYVLQAEAFATQTNLKLHVRRHLVPERLGRSILNALQGIMAGHRVKGDMQGEDRDPLTYPSVLTALDKQIILSPLPSRHVYSSSTLHGLFKASAQKVPGAQAVLAWDGSLSYAELDSLSSTAATALAQLGVGLGDLVPFCFEKSMWAIVAVLAILKAGAGFVPITPAQPASRVRDIIQDTRAKAVISSCSQRDRFASLVADVLVISSLVHSIRGPPTPPSEPAEEGPSQCGPQDTAAVLFTSGSTGRAKGIVLSHRTLCTHMLENGQMLDYRGARTFQFSAISWDVFVIDMFTTLAFEGCLCMPSDEGRLVDIEGTAESMQANLAMLTSSVANLLEPDAMPSLKHLLIGGESLNTSVVQKWRDVKGLRKTQIYGPAETGICIAGTQAFGGGRPESLGHPLPNFACLLVDPNNPNRLVPVGAVGELVVGGPGIATEYLNDPQKTRAAFLDNPSWAQQLNLPARRFYRTGDLMRYSLDSLDGCFDFIGRKDFQVKRNGQRVELQEIEQQLSKAPWAAANVVLFPKTGPFKNQLVAVVEQKFSHRFSKDYTRQALCLDEEATVTLAQMQDQLASTLPPYMIPEALLLVRDMPFTASMKLNRQEVGEWLSSMDNDPIQARLKLLTPLGPDEPTSRRVSQIVAEILFPSNIHLQKDLIGTDFSLQQVGLDSIGRMSLSKQIRGCFGVPVPSQMLHSPITTVRDIAKTVDSSSSFREQETTSVAITNKQTIWDIAKDLESEVLDSVSTSHVNPKPLTILLTGATGFLGMEILYQLLSHGDVTIVLLVRASSTEAARNRVITQATQLGWWQSAFEPRLVFWLGDLAQPRLGLGEAERHSIEGKAVGRYKVIDSIIHNGAKVHYRTNYDDLMAENVGSTAEMLRMIRGRNSLHSFVYVSGGQKDLLEIEYSVHGPADSLSLDSGYGASKLVSEVLIRNCTHKPDFRNSSLRIVRPGFIIGSDRDGITKQTDYFWRVIAACIEIGGFDAEEADHYVYVSGVNSVAAAVVDSALEEDWPAISTLLDGLPLRDIWRTLESDFAISLAPLTKLVWLDRVRQAVVRKQEGHVLFPLLDLVEAGALPLGVPRGPQKGPSATAVQALKASIAHLVGTGFIPDLLPDKPTN